MSMSREQRRVLQETVRMLAELRLKLTDGLELFTKLGIRAREMERDAEMAYDQLRKLLSEPKALEGRLRRKLKKPRKMPAGDRDPERGKGA